MAANIDILFIIPPFHRRNGSGSIFPLGTGAIMACLETNHMTYDYIDCTQIIDTLWPNNLRILEEYLRDELKHYNPLLIGIGPCVTPGVRALEVVSRCCLEIFGKSKVFAGGPFTLLPSQEWFFYENLKLDYLIKGDGEEAVCKAIETLKMGQNLKQCEVVSYPGYSKINIVQDLDKMPFPKRVQLEKNVFSERRRHEKVGTKTAHIVASRSCPYHCDYCVSGNIKIPFRRRSPNNIVAEMKMLVDKYGITDIVFYDDCFFPTPTTVHRDITAFCNALKNADLHLTWQIEIRPDVLVEIKDDELKKLSQHGCRQMNIGVEKTNKYGAMVFGKKFDFERLKTYLSNVHRICSIRMTGTFILGGKDETVTSIRELIKASANMNLDEAEYSPLFVYPDTPIYDEVFSSPREWVDIVIKSDEPWGEVVYENKELDKKTLISLVNEAYECFYGGTNTSKRIHDRYHLRG